MAAQQGLKYVCPSKSNFENSQGNIFLLTLFSLLCISIYCQHCKFPKVTEKLINIPELLVFSANNSLKLPMVTTTVAARRANSPIATVAQNRQC